MMMSGDDDEASRIFRGWCGEIDRDDDGDDDVLVVYMSVYIHMYIYRSESVWMHGTHPMWRPE